MNKDLLRQMNSKEPWWKILLISLFTYGVLATLLTFVPEYSLIFMILGIALAITATVSAILQRVNGYEWIKIITTQASLLIFFLLGVRLWLFYAPSLWLWLFLFVAAYIFAWYIPYLSPRISKILWREQINPETSAGKSILRAGLILLPIAGSGGAFIAMYASRYGFVGETSRIMGPIIMMATIAWAQVVSHQLMKERRGIIEPKIFD